MTLQKISGLGIIQVASASYGNIVIIHRPKYQVYLLELASTVHDG